MWSLDQMEVYTAQFLLVAKGKEKLPLSLSDNNRALVVVEFLNELYKVMDEQIDNYDVYKVETIKDSYLVVSGVPTRNGDRWVAIHCVMRVRFTLLRHMHCFQTRCCNLQRGIGLAVCLRNDKTSRQPDAPFDLDESWHPFR